MARYVQRSGSDVAKAHDRHPPAPPKGNQRNLVHGAHSATPPGLDEARAQVYAWLGDRAPVVDAADDAVLELTARALARYRVLDNYVAEHGFVNRRGQISSPAQHLEKVQRNLADLLDRLGMTPRSRARLGLDLARTIDVASAMSEPDPVRRAELLRQAGLGGAGSHE